MTAPRVLLYSAVFGGYDTVKPVAAQTVEHDQVMIHDGVDGVDGSTWTSSLAHGKHNYPRLAGRFAKCFVPAWQPAWTHSIWIDGSITVLSPSFVADMLALVPDDGADFALFAHPDRDNLLDEIEAARPMGKYAGVEHDRMVADLCRDARHNQAGPPLYACPILVRRHTARMAELGRRWWAETLAWSTDTAVALDQLSLPPLLTALDITPAVIPGNLWAGGAGGWFTITHHPVDR